MISQQKEDNALKQFFKKKIMTISEIAQLMESSIPTVRNRLKKWQTYNSYNKNGRYYTLPNIAKFDQNGIWKYKGVFFSKHGNMSQTISHLVNISQSGFNASQIAEMLGLSPNPRSFISYFKTISGLHREKQKGRTVYFSAEKSIYSLQKQRRENQAKVKEKDINIQLPSESDAITILVDIIKHPKTTVKKCAERLKKKGQGTIIQPGMIRNLLQYHGIEIEKKTPVIPS
jgi:DNA-binding transcriptional regulator GbsR (MarR family)